MRSWYLDDMSLNRGDMVVCKASIAALHITAGKTYTVEPRDVGCVSGPLNGIVNDAGRWCIPSARFQRA